MSVARLLAGIGLNTEDFKKGIDEVNTRTQGAKKEFSALGKSITAAFSVAAVTSWINTTMRVADELKNAADSANATFLGFQALRNALGDAGGKADLMAMALQKLYKATLSATEGNTKMELAFSALGLSMTDVAGLKTDRVFELIAERVKDSENSTGAMNAVFEIFGETAGQLTPVLKQLADDGLQSVIDQQTKLNRLMNEDWAESANKFRTGLDTSKQVLMAFTADVVTGLGWVARAIKEAFDADRYRQGLIPLYDTFRDINDEAEQRTLRRIMAEVDAQTAAQAEITSRIKAAHEQRQRDAEAAFYAEKAAGVKAADERGMEIRKLMDAYATEAKRRAQSVADAEIEESRRTAEEIKLQWDELQSARMAYYAALNRAAWDSISAEEQLNHLQQTRVSLMAAIASLQKAGQTESAEYYRMQIDLLALNGDIERRNRDIRKSEKELGKTRKNEGLAARNITEDQVKALESMQAFLSGMTDKELDEFLGVLEDLHKGIKDLDFSNLQGLEALRNFKIPNESVMNAQQFGRALAAMAGEIKGLKIPDLAPLEVLKGFKIPNETTNSARQFANSIMTLVESINNQGLDLDPIEKLADLFEAINVGRIELAITPPTRDQLTLVVDDSFKSDVAKLSQGVSTLAAMKGIIYQ